MACRLYYYLCFLSSGAAVYVLLFEAPARLVELHGSVCMVLFVDPEPQQEWRPCSRQRCFDILPLCVCQCVRV